MFERIKAYKNLYKSNKFLKGVKIVAEMTDDENLLKEVNETIYLNDILKRKLWRKRYAKNYNLELLKRGM